MTPLAVVPSSVLANVASLVQTTGLDCTGSSAPSLSSVLNDGLGSASVAVDQTTVSGDLANLNVFKNSTATSRPLAVNVSSVAAALSAINCILSQVSGVDALSTVQSTLDTIVQGTALQQYVDNYVKPLVANGTVQVPPVSAAYPCATPPCSAAGSVGNALPTANLIAEGQALAPYTANANNGDTTANPNGVNATSSIDALSVLNAPGVSLPMSSNIALLNGLISQLTTAVPQTAPIASNITGATQTISGLTGTLSNTVTATVGSTGLTLPAGTSLPDVGKLVAALVDLSNVMNAMQGSLIDLSSVVSTKDVASNVTTQIVNNGVKSIADTKAAEVDVLTSSALTGLLTTAGICNVNAATGSNDCTGQPLLSILGASSHVETFADGTNATATGTPGLTSITVLPGTTKAMTFSGSSLPLVGQSQTFTVPGTPLQLVVSLGACSCHAVPASGSQPSTASASLSAIDIQLNWLGGTSSLLNGLAGATPLTSASTLNIAHVQLANASADSGQKFEASVAVLPPTGSPYGAGLLVGFALLAVVAGLGIAQRRFFPAKSGRGN